MKQSTQMKIAGGAAMMVSVAAALFAANSIREYQREISIPTINITNPVLVDNGDEQYAVLSCENGELNSQRPEFPDGHQIWDIDKERLEVKYDNLPSQRPRLVEERVIGSLDSGVLHLRPGEKIPMYHSYGEGGARGYNATGKYSCPAEQWRD